MAGDRTSVSFGGESIDDFIKRDDKRLKERDGLENRLEDNLKIKKKPIAKKIYHKRTRRVNPRKPRAPRPRPPAPRSQRTPPVPKYRCPIDNSKLDHWPDSGYDTDYYCRKCELYVQPKGLSGKLKYR